MFSFTSDTMCERQEEQEQELEVEEEVAVWQREEARCAVVLHEVFRWLRAREVCAASGVCAAWRRAAGSRALWRRLLQRDAGLAPAELRALASVCWREEYARTFARWERRAVVRCGGSAAHAALDPAGGARLALLTDDDAALTIWRYSRSLAERGWRAAWRCELRRHGWAGVGRVQWAGSRLLLAGPLALAHAPAWELLVLQLDENGEGRVASRARCGAGGAGCWADAAGEVFLSLEPAVFAPGVAATTVWLNSASQETQSEHAGVRAPLFRIYNESGEHCTQACVVECPAGDAGGAGGDATTDLGFYLDAIKQGEPGQGEPGQGVTMRVLVTTSGCGKGGGGGGGMASAWGMPAVRPPAVSAAERGGDLRERARRAAAALAPPAAPIAPPAEHEVRALCTPPDDTCALPAPVVGLTPHRSGRCLWLALSSGEPWCLSLPTLRPLRRLAPLAASPPSPPPYLYYIQPSVSDSFLASPMPARVGAGAGAAGAGVVCVWSALSGGAAPVDRLPALPAPPVQALLLPGADALLVLVADTIHIWRSRAASCV